MLKLPCQAVVGTCNQVTYTYSVVNTGAVPLTNVQITDNIGTASHPNNVTPTAVTSHGFNVGDTDHNGLLDTGETWQYTNTINELGGFGSRSSSQSHMVSGHNLTSGCTAWLNSSFTPTSCKDGSTYVFKDISCKISGPGCSTTTVKIPDAYVTFSKGCSSPTTTFNSSQNCWITTLPANCNPGDVFLSGLPFQVPSGSNLSDASIAWSIGSSGNNCGSSSLSWDTGCTGYGSFNQNNCDGSSDYNQIGVKVCDNGSGYGSGGNTDQGYGWNYGGGGGYCGGYSNYGWGGGWSGSGSDWQGSSKDCAGTPENQYTGSNDGYPSYGSYSGSWGYGGYGYGSTAGYGSGGNNNGGVCDNGGGSGTCYQGQLGDNPQADTVTVTAQPLGHGFDLGDAANYGIITFSSGTFKGSSSAIIHGDVGLGAYCGTVSVKLYSERIDGDLVTTGTSPRSTGGTVTGHVTGYSSSLSGDISALQSLSATLAGEPATTLSLSSGMVIDATAGVLDNQGNYVFNITRWANNITIKGDGSHNVVLNISSKVVPVLENVSLTGGLTANQVLFNDQDDDTITGVNNTTFNATFLAPNATFEVTGVTVNGHLFGGANGDTFGFTAGATLNTPANTGGSTSPVTTVAASDSKEIQVLSNNSSISVNGNTPTGSLSQLYGTGQRIEFSYTPKDTVSLKQIQSGLATVSGQNANPMAFIEISNSSNPFASNAQIYFEGEVITGEKVFADAAYDQLTNTPNAAPNNHFSTVAGSDIYAFVFNSQADLLNHASPIQTISYNTSGSQAMHFGDQIGSLTVVGYVGTSGGHLVS